jgi:hypothetical protein
MPASSYRTVVEIVFTINTTNHLVILYAEIGDRAIFLECIEQGCHESLELSRSDLSWRVVRGGSRYGIIWCCHGLIMPSERRRLG